MRVESKYLVTILGDETRQENVVNPLFEEERACIPSKTCHIAPR
jgi:hypothetical protein